MKKINMQDIMVEAHARTKEFVELYKVDYKTQLNLFISYLLEEGYQKLELEKTAEKDNTTYTIEDYKRVASYIINKGRIFEGLRIFKGKDLVLTGNIDINLLELKEHEISKVTLSNYYEYENEIISHILEYLILDSNNRIGQKAFWQYVNKKTASFLRLEQRRGGVQKPKKVKLINYDSYIVNEEEHQSYNNIEDFINLENEKMIDLVKNHELLTDKQLLYINARLRDIKEQKVLPSRDLFKLYDYNAMLNSKELKALRNKVSNILKEKGYNISIA